jgi:hypothetical protein
MTEADPDIQQNGFPARQADHFLILLFIAELALITVTWPLWMTTDRFPAVPLLTVFDDVPVIVDQCCTAVLCLALIAGCVAVWRGNRPNDCLVIAFLCGITLAVLNQHRLQPWHWLFILVSAQALLLPKESHTAAFRLTIASIYIFAAASRWGADIDSGMSRQVLTVLTKAVGAETLLRSSSFVFGCCVAMTVVEFLTGVLLLTPRLRRLARGGAIGMHATLMFALSPLGMNHHLGVLVWNAFLLIAVPVLFATRAGTGVEIEDGLASGRARILMTFVVLFPLSGLCGIADNWLSWQVYSPRPEVVRIHVREDYVSVLPSDLQPFVGQPAPLDVWCPVRIDQWSLTAVAVPMYPEDRFQLAIAGQLMEIVDDHAIKVQLDEPQRQPWRKHRVEIVDRAVLNDRLSRFVFNGNRVRSSGWKTTP